MPLRFQTVANALAATEWPPVMTVLNGCDTLTGAEVLLESVQVVVAMASSVTDLGASAFAGQFYAAIAAGQPVGYGYAIRQGKLALEVLANDEEWKPAFIARDGVDVNRLAIVRGA